MEYILPAGLLALITASALIVVLRPLAFSVGLVDRPSHRKLHSGEVPVVGGVAMYAGVIVASVSAGDLAINGAVLLTASALMVLVGVLDDRFDIHPLFRLLAHAAAALALIWGTRCRVASLGDLFGLGSIDLGVLSVPFTLLSCIALINAFNMLDGLDGLAGGVGVIAFGALTAVSITAGAGGPAIIATSLAGAIGGFLLFNIPAKFNRGMRTFMGDAGSTLLGFALAGLSLILIQPNVAHVPPMSIPWFMAIPIFELFTSTVRRLMNGTSPLRADTGHFHHQLVAAGFSVRLVFGIYLLVSVSMASAGLAATAGNVPDSVLFFGFLAAFALWLAFVYSARAIASILPSRWRRDREAVTH
jgi:UDP-GlcNAc:undecaprenyl-phosphate/decaprenyl-phosphate GlcNAc-1-phosphate transferase